MMPDNRHRPPASKPVLAARPVEDMPEAAWIAQDLPLEESPLAHTFKMLARLTPVRAGQLSDEYEKDVRPALRHARDAEPHEHALLDKANLLAQKENKALDAQQVALGKERDMATQSDRALLQRLLAALSQAHVLASGLQSAADGTEYDPDDPSDARVLNIASRPLEVIAPSLGLPYPTSDDKVRLTHTGAITSIAIYGAILRTSYGLFTAHLRSGALDAHPGVLLGHLAGGMGVAGLWHLALKLFPYLASNRYYRLLPARQWLLCAVLAVCTFALFLWVDSLGTSLGMFKSVAASGHPVSIRSATPSHHADAGATWFLMAFFCSFPFGLLAVVDGYFVGRKNPIENRLLAQQRLELETAEADRRSHSIVQQALLAVALVRAIKHDILRATQSIQNIAKPFEEQIALLEGHRLPIRVELDEAAQERIRAAQSKAVSTLNEWRGRLETVAGEYVRPRASAHIS